ncbi:MAG: PQQ-dependent sugar dehydrogenase [Nannocystaceae bacterium]
MLDRALHALPLLGLAASALAISGCPGDDGSGSGTASASGSTTQPGPTETSGPVTATDDTTGSDTTVTPEPETGETGDSTGTTTGNPLECPYDEVEGSPPVAFELVGSGFDRPLLAIGHPTEPDRLFVLEQGGNVRILEPGQTTAPASAFLTVDVRGANNSTIGPEFGLLGFAFHPDFPTDPRVYVNYNPPLNGGPMHTIVSEFTVDATNPDQVDPASERVILDLHQPADNHNGGMIAFGGDGYLYIGMGDGGGGGDTFNTGRAPQFLHAKVLRIGVEPDGSPDDPQACAGCPQYGPFDYTIPDDNPFVADAAFAPEIYAWGVRNPWRFARDPETDLIYAGDVGQGNREEVSLVSSGADLGWSTMEGFSCFDGPCAPAAGPNEINGDGMTMPLVDYDHGGGRCSVTGLSVYRSCQVPGWDGVYFYADYCSRDVFALFWDGSTVQDLGEVFSHNEFITGNGWNAYGDVFVTTVDAIFGLPIEDGLVYRIAPG